MKAQNSYQIVIVFLIAATLLGCSPSEERQASGSTPVSANLSDTETAAAPILENTATTVPTSAPTHTPSPSPAPTETPIPTETATNKPSPTITPTDTPTATPTPPSQPELQITSSSANVRNGPGTDFETLATLAEGETVAVLATNNDGSWYNVLLEDGSTGWLAASVASPLSEEALALVPVAATIPAPPPASPTSVAAAPVPTLQSPAPSPGMLVLTFVNQTPNRDVDVSISYQDLRFPVLKGETVVKELPPADYRLEIQSGSCGRGLPNIHPDDRVVTIFFIPTEGECDWYVSMLRG